MAENKKMGSGARALHVKVKKGKVKASSRRWIERQLNDPYVHRAKQDGYRSRAAYKLLEINEKHPILTSSSRVVDLGSAPGGWSQIAAKVTGSTDQQCKVAAIDYLEMETLAGVSFLQKDFLDDDAPQLLLDALGARPNLVLSDMAAPTTGHKQTDHLRTMMLCEVAADFALQNLVKGGHFLAKTFQGGTANQLQQQLKSAFARVKHIKPAASRKESVELYILAMDFGG